jgi:hypothetical protein
MESGTLPGSCLCGAIRFAIELPTLLCAHCHCSVCRRAHGAAFVTWITLPIVQFTLLAGQERLVRYRSSDHGTRSFCATCGSSLFFETTQYPDRIDIALANMEGAIDHAPQCHIFFSDRVDWVQVADELPRLGGATGMDPL